MRTLSFKTFTFAALLTAGSLTPTLAHAAILRSSNGMPVLTKDGACVTTGWQGGESCEAAKKAALIGDISEPCAAPEKDAWDHHDKVVYFEFNKSTLTARAQHHLDHVAEKIARMTKRKGRTPHITIVGYADRLGKAEYNQKLALKRAMSVRDYLLSKGVDTKKIVVRSLGKTAPKADCSADLTRTKMIECLREDRRVDIEFGHDSK